MRSDRALVIGGGLAGSALAGCLARGGREVLLVERTSAPQDKMCGDFLSQEALHYLGRSGVDPMALGGVALTAVRVARREVLAEARLPFRAVSLRRCVLDEALLRQAARDGVGVRRGTRVQSLTRDGMPDGTRDGTRHVARLDGEGDISAASVFLATGKHDLHGQARRGGWHNDLVAFKMYFRLSEAQQQELARHIELILFPGGYGGLQPVDGGLANFCLLVTRAQFRRCGANWVGLFAMIREHSAHLARRLEGATPMLAKPLALTSIPYGFLARAPMDGVWRLGDQAAVIPSFSGDGMSIALHSAHVAAAMFLEGASPAAFAARMRHDLRQGIGLATALSHVLVRLPGAAAATSVFPSLLGRIGRATRIPDGALVR